VGHFVEAEGDKTGEASPNRTRRRSAGQQVKLKAPLALGPLFNQAGYSVYSREVVIEEPAQPDGVEVPLLELVVMADAEVVGHLEQVTLVLVGQHGLDLWAKELKHRRLGPGRHPVGRLA